MANWRILIADDDEAVRQVLREHLESLGHLVVAECLNGLEVVEQAAQVSPDLMILDIRMPEMDGIEAAKRAQLVSPCAVLFLTGYVEDELIQQAGEVGAGGYLVKPIRGEEIRPAIEIAVKRFRERVATEKEAEHLREALEARKLVDRAKAYLMNSKGMTEEQAFKTIHFGARNSSRTMREVAIEVLQQAGIPI
ncbi:MAG: transcriptional regulator [Fimbriimonadales bacterium]